MAAGRPAVVQDTGWSAHLPAGEGLLGFTTREEAIDGLSRIERDYDRHARAAARIAAEYFDAARGLPRLLDPASA